MIISILIVYCRAIDFQLEDVEARDFQLEDMEARDFQLEDVEARDDYSDFEMLV